MTGNIARMRVVCLTLLKKLTLTRLIVMTYRKITRHFQFFTDKYNGWINNS